MIVSTMQTAAVEKRQPFFCIWAEKTQNARFFCKKRFKFLCRPVVLNLDPFQLRQDRDQHRENAGGSADDIGNRLGEEYAVGSHMHGVGEKVGQRYDDEYFAEQGEEDLYFSVEAGTGKKLLVLQVAVTNPGQEQVEFDTLHKQNIKYRVMLNGADRHQVMLTMLDNDFSAMDIIINPGETMQTVLLAEVSEETAGQITSVDFVIRSDSDEVTLTP